MLFSSRKTSGALEYHLAYFLEGEKGQAFLCSFPHLLTFQIPFLRNINTGYFHVLVTDSLHPHVI